MSNAFEELYAINVSEHVEKKGKFSYLSWPYAVAELRKRHPEATWTVVKNDGVPFLATPAGVFVEVAVTVNGITLSQIHPVLNGQNKPIYEPNAFDINTSIQRCLVKAIALHGLGLYIYAGEDLPEIEPVKKQGGLSGIGDDLPEDEKAWLIEVSQYITSLVQVGDIATAKKKYVDYKLDDTQHLFVDRHLDSKTRTAMRKAETKQPETV